jgi:hypothetical protein
VTNAGFSQETPSAAFATRLRMAATEKTNHPAAHKGAKTGGKASTAHQFPAPNPHPPAKPRATRDAHAAHDGAQDQCSEMTRHYQRPTAGRLPDSLKILLILVCERPGTRRGGHGGCGRSRPSCPGSPPTLRANERARLATCADLSSRAMARGPLAVVRGAPAPTLMRRRQTRGSRLRHDLSGLAEEWADQPD